MSSLPDPVPPRRGNGCLFGCLALILVVALPVVLAAGYGTWRLTRGAQNDPVVQLARDLVSRDGMTRQLLGAPVTVTGVTGNGWSWASGVGASHAYVLSLAGPNGQASLEIRARAGAGGPRLDQAILVTPDGLRFDLLHQHPPSGGQDLSDTI